jgi:SAM-dependent methyltransferase
MNDTPNPAAHYDEVPYPSRPFLESHPDRMAAIAKLFGLNPPAVETARILEVGCSMGNNIIPVAEVLPRAELLAIDFSPREIAEGKKTVEVLGLTNVELRVADLCDFHQDRKFDFIIAHGVYSWISRAAQGKLLQLIREHLSPQGIAYVSYNTLPGWHIRGMIRDMMLRHTNKFRTAAEKVQQARALLNMLAEAAENERGPYAQFLKAELASLSQQPDGYLYHEHLEAENNPVYFEDFMMQARAAGLGYLADSKLCLMVTSDLNSFAQKLLSSSKSILQTEQYVDFIRNRMFRMSLLVHDGQRPVYNVNAKRIREFYVAASLRGREPFGDIRGEEPAEYESSGRSLRTRSPVVKAALQVLADAFPCALHCEELARLACERLGRSVPADEAEADRVIVLKLLAVIGYGPKSSRRPMP